MTVLCPSCWRTVALDAARCPHCGADIQRLHERDFREKLLGALSHPDRDTVVRAVSILAARHDPETCPAVERLIHRFANEPHVLAGLLGALTAVPGPEARRIALDALGHPSFMVRRAAAQVLKRLDETQPG
jgi:HEAT repeat protein